jgi:hypothetical protein
MPEDTRSGSPYRVAFDLMKEVMGFEHAESWTREKILALYRECLQATQRAAGSADEVP